MSSLFAPRFYSQPEPNFRGLFRLLDDFDQYSSQNNQDGSQSAVSFVPKFDFKETEENYELHGELPGIEKENVTIDFTDPQTIVIRGKVERSYTSGTPPSLEGKPDESKGQITDSEKPQAEEKKPHKVTVEDENDTDAKTSTENQESSDNKEVAKADESSKAPAAKYWVSERSIGQFSRSFHFPSRIDQDAVSASLKNGVLTVTVPKAKKHESKRVTIS